MQQSRTVRWFSRRTALLGLSLAAAAAAAQAAERNLAELSLDELMNEPVTSVSKKETRLGDAATAITVITADDMRRLGITSIPEALRLAPGYDVARVDSSQWAISSRGFNEQYSDKLLVLLDGRSVYTPAFGGVYWESLDIVLEDIERIEVIRGPGAALWGANAVNGVVNIITKSAQDTQGGLFTGSAGTEDRPSVQARYGGAQGETLYYRAYAKYFERKPFSVSADEPRFAGDWDSLHIGARSDWIPSEDRTLTVEAEYYRVAAERTMAGVVLGPPYVELSDASTPTHGGDVRVRWTEALSNGSRLSVQSYVDSYDRYAESRDTADLQAEHQFTWGSRQEIVWGGGYRYSKDDEHFGPGIATTPRRRAINLYTAFFNDDVTLIPARLRATAGVKIEHNDFTGLETQPTLRVLWTVSDQTTAWAAVSRAVSTPSRFYDATRVDVVVFPSEPDGTLVEVALLPNPNLPSQVLLAYESGLRLERAERWSADLAFFYNTYSHVYVSVPGMPFFDPEPVPHAVLPVTWQAVADVQTYGTDLTLNYKPLDTWRLTATYAYLKLHQPSEWDISVTQPLQQATLRVYASLRPDLELNAAFYYVDKIRSINGAQIPEDVPAYLRADVGLVYRPTPRLELGLWGQNLLDARHPEIASLSSNGLSQISRSMLARITQRF